MVETKDIYCRVSAMKRLEEKGLDKREAFLIATDIKNIVDGALTDAKNIRKKSN